MNQNSDVSSFIRNIINGRFVNEASSLNEDLTDRISELNVEDLDEFQKRYDEIKGTNENE